MIQGWESFMMTWLSRQQSLECSNVGNGARLRKHAASYFCFWKLNSLHKVKQNKNKTN